MAARSFTVETRGQGVLVLGGNPELSNKIIEEFVLIGAKAISPESAVDIEQLRQSHDIDYILIFADYQVDNLAKYLESLIRSGESKLIYLSHISSTAISVDQSHISKKIEYGDYIGKSAIESPFITNLLSSITGSRAIQLTGDGLAELHILGISDLARLVVAAVVRPGQGTRYVLGNPSGVSHLNFAYLLRSNLPFKLGITFVAADAALENSVPVEEYELSLKKLDIKIEEGIEAYLQDHLANLTYHSIVSPVAPVKKVEPTPVSASPDPFVTKPVKKLTPLSSPQAYFVPLQSRRKKLSLDFKFKIPKKQKSEGPPSIRTIIGRGLLIALGLYLGTLAFTGTIAALSFKNIYSSLANDSLPTPNNLNTLSLSYIRANWYMLSSLPVISQNQKVSEINQILDAYGEFNQILDHSTSLGESSEKLVKYIFGGGEADIASLISLSRLEAESLYQKLSLLDGSLPAEPPSVIPARYHESYVSGKTKLVKLKNTISSTRALLATAPEIIGVGARRKYGVLFQNNMELRATGGFIGSFAILSFENGKLYDMPIYDVYDADGQLKGHVEPPPAIKEILGEANWYLRDSNFDPDFPTSARRAEWFIKKTLNQDLDGIIAVNVNTLKALLGATGPIELSDYEETITKDNLYERTQFHAEVNFFPGSTQKKEFLSTVANSLFARLPSLNSSDGLKLAAALTQSIEEKDTLISVLNETSEHVFQTLGWNGQIKDPPCPSTSDCYKDYAMVVDSNFGVNKANYFVKRNIEQVITLDKNLVVNHVMRLSYLNTSTSTAWPAGAFKNYQRIYLPQGSNITSLSIDKTPLPAKSYTISQEHNKTVVAHLVTVPINSSLEVTIEYTTPQIKSGDAPLYTWYWQKQPGTNAEDPLKVYLNFPMYLSPQVVSPPAEANTQQLVFDLTNDKDRRLATKFTK